MLESFGSCFSQFKQIHLKVRQPNLILICLLRDTLEIPSLPQESEQHVNLSRWCIFTSVSAHGLLCHIKIFISHASSLNASSSSSISSSTAASDEADTDTTELLYFRCTLHPSSQSVSAQCTLGRDHLQVKQTSPESLGSSSCGVHPLCPAHFTSNAISTLRRISPPFDRGGCVGVCSRCQ